MERGGALGVGHRGRQLRHLPQPHHGSVHRVSGESGVGHVRGVHGGVGDVQPRLPLPLHLALAQDASSLPARQSRLGVPEIRTLKKKAKPKFNETIKYNKERNF